MSSQLTWHYEFEYVSVFCQPWANPNIKWLGNTSLIEYSDEDSIDMVKLFLIAIRSLMKF